MKLGDWLDQERGRLARMAEHFGVSMSAVSQWRTDGVPVGRMRGVSLFTENSVPLEDMVPSQPAAV